MFDNKNQKTNTTDLCQSVTLLEQPVCLSVNHTPV